MCHVACGMCLSVCSVRVPRAPVTLVRVRIKCLPMPQGSQCPAPSAFVPRRGRAAASAACGCGPAPPPQIGVHICHREAQGAPPPPQGCIGRGGGIPPPPRAPSGKCQLQWHW